MALTPRQARFAEEYLVDLNATQAAIRAGYSSKTAHSAGPRLLENVGVQAAIARAMEERSRRTALTADRVLEEIAKIAFSDVRRLFDGEGNALRPGDLDDDTAAAIASIKVTEQRRPDGDGKADMEQVREVRMVDKLGALNLAARHLGLLVDKSETKNEVTGKDGGPVQHEHTLKVEFVG